MEEGGRVIHKDGRHGIVVKAEDGKILVHWGILYGKPVRDWCSPADLEINPEHVYSPDEVLQRQGTYIEDEDKKTGGSDGK